MEEYYKTVIEEDNELQLLLEDLKDSQVGGLLRRDAQAAHVRRHRCIVHPESPVKRYWDVWIAALALASCTMVPLQLAFDDFSGPGVEFFNWTFDVRPGPEPHRPRIPQTPDAFLAPFPQVCFITDIAVSFRTAVLLEGVYVREPRKIARRYVRSWWFFLDVLSGFPLGRFMTAVGFTSRIFRVNQVRAWA